LDNSEKLTRAIARKVSRKSGPLNYKLDMYKLVFDLMKHITTLSSGSILIFITLLEKVFKTKPPVGMLITTFGLFSVSIAAAVMAMMVLALNATEGKMSEDEKHWFAYSAAVASTAFTMGILFVALYAIIFS